MGAGAPTLPGTYGCTRPLLHRATRLLSSSHAVALGAAWHGAQLEVASPRKE